LLNLQSNTAALLLLKQVTDSQIKNFPLRLPEAAKTQGIKAIVADDDEVVREIVAAPLRKWGWR
jgi:hypothetical protein